jgi:putative tryptophan/tyrosine transport system substrate-binding protein
MLWNKNDLGMSLRYEASAKAAQEIGVTVQPLGVREPDDFNEAFAATNREPRPNPGTLGRWRRSCLHPADPP